MKVSTKTLYIVSTPIGNLDDITFRAVEVLKKSDIILCEDTRRSKILLDFLKLKNKLISYHKFNEKKQTKEIIKYFNQGKILSLISDAGTPLLSDPGLILLNECIENKINVTPIPGVSSITTAMSVSGFKDQFLFYGFLPKNEKAVDDVLSSLVSLTFTQVFFIPAIKVNFYLKKIKKYFPDRKLVIAREMTKIHETFYRNEVNNFKLFNNPIKGELTIILSGKETKKNDPIDKGKIINRAKKYLKKYSLKDTVDLILETEKLNKKEIYQLCLKIKNEESN